MVYSELIKNFFIKTSNYYEIPLKEPKQINFMKKRFLLPFFENKIIDENYVDNFNTENALKRVDNSIMYKKNRIEDDDNEVCFLFLFKFIYNILFFWKDFKKYMEYKIYQSNGISRIKSLLFIILVIILVHNFILYYEFKNIKLDKLIEENNKLKTASETLGLYSNEYRCLMIDINNCDYYTELSCY